MYSWESDHVQSRQDKREAILATALRLFADRGFVGTPTSLISKEAGVATGTLFFYFKTKEDLIDDLYKRIKAEAAQALCRGLKMEKTGKGKLRRLGNNAVTWGMRNPEKKKVLEMFAQSPFVSAGAQEEGMSHFIFLKDIIHDGIQEGVIRDMDPALLFCMMAAAINGLVSRASVVKDPMERDRIIAEGLDFVWNGMKT